MNLKDFEALRDRLIGKRVISLTNWKGVIKGVRNTVPRLYEIQMDDYPELVGKNRMCVDFGSQWKLMENEEQCEPGNDKGLNFCKVDS